MTLAQTNKNLENTCKDTDTLTHTQRCLPPLPDSQTLALLLLHWHLHGANMWCMFWKKAKYSRMPISIRNQAMPLPWERPTSSEQHFLGNNCPFTPIMNQLQYAGCFACAPDLGSYHRSNPMPDSHLWLKHNTAFLWPRGRARGEMKELINTTLHSKTTQLCNGANIT